jgi:hypothetical protein
MARDYARVKLSIWADDDFRMLSREAQHLYFVLLTSPKLDYCGVTDWRAGRIAALSNNWIVEQVEEAAAELSRGLYLVIDEETEEVLIRSFVRNDGLMDQPNMAVSMMKAQAAVASTALRQIVLHELKRLKAKEPHLKGWARLGDLLDNPSLDPSDYPSFTPSVRASVDPSVSPSGEGSVGPKPKASVDPSPTPAPSPTPTPAPPSGAPHKRGTRLPKDWKPTEEDVTWQRSKNISDLLARRELEKFTNYWNAKSGKDATKLDWSATWRNWLLTSQEREPRKDTRPAAAGSGRYQASTEW